MDEIERLFIIRIRDPDTRALVRGRLGNMGAVAVTDNIWELPRNPMGDPEMEAQWWDEQLQWFEDTIDRRTDVIYMWVCSSGSIVRSAIGGGE